MKTANDNKSKPVSDTVAALWITCEVLFFIGGIVAAIWSSPYWLLFSLLAFALLMGGV